jgi:hypothetical protein
VQPRMKTVAREVMSSDQERTPEGWGQDPQTDLGGADAVEKTTYVVGEGTEPEQRPAGPYVARGAAGLGDVRVWIVVAIAVLIALVYAIGVFR